MTKLVIGLTFVAILAGFVIRFREFVAPLLLAFIMAYVLYPVANIIRKWTGINWRVIVTLLYLIIIVLFIGILIWGGLALFDQIQSIIQFIHQIIDNLRELANLLSLQAYKIGPLIVDLRSTDLISTIDQLSQKIEPMLTNQSPLLQSTLSTVIAVISWAFFVIITSFFLLGETEGNPGRIINMSIPGYQIDLMRMSNELGRIWNAFLRGQLLMVLLTFIVYLILLAALGVHFPVVLALMAAMARLVPYIGPAAAWSSYALVSYSQIGNPFGLSPLGFGLLVVGLAIIIDSIMDSFVSPRILGNALQVHPAAVMAAALMAASLLGVVGVIMAAPVLASLILICRYCLRKMFDLDPWTDMPSTSRPLPSYIPRSLRSFIKDPVRWIRHRLTLLRKPKVEKQ